MLAALRRPPRWGACPATLVEAGLTQTSRTVLRSVPPLQSPPPHRHLSAPDLRTSELVDPSFIPTLPLPPFSPAIRRWLRPYKPGPLSPAQLSQFFEWGYVIVPRLLEASDLQPSMAAIGQQVDDIARALHRAGHLRDLCEGEGFFHRLTRLEAQFPSLSVLLHKQGKLPVEMYRLWSHPKLMAIAHQVLGPDVSGQRSHPLLGHLPL